MMSLFADDATFVGPGAITYRGPAAIGRGCLTTGSFKATNNWVGLTPTFRTKIVIVDAGHATMYFECDYVDRGTLQIKAQLSAVSTEVRQHDQWLFETLAGGAPPAAL